VPHVDPPQTSADLHRSDEMRRFAVTSAGWPMSLLSGDHGPRPTASGLKVLPHSADSYSAFEVLLLDRPSSVRGEDGTVDIDAVVGQQESDRCR